MATIRPNRHGYLEIDFRVPRVGRIKYTLPGELTDTPTNQKFAKTKYLDKLEAAERLDKLREVAVELFPNCERLRELGVVPGGKLTVADLLDRLETKWEEDGNDSLKDLRYKLKPVREFLGADYAADVDGLRIEAFAKHRKKEGDSTATRNRRLAHLKTAFNLAVKKGLLDKIPGIAITRENNARELFFERPDQDRLLPELEEWHREACEVAYYTGWRKDAVLSRTKDDIQEINGEEFLYLDRQHSKNGKDVWFPLNAYPELRAALERQLAYVRRLEIELTKERGRLVSIPWLFPSGDPHERLRGKRMNDFEKAFDSAAERAGLNIDPKTGAPWKHSKTGELMKRLFHDYRRTATRNLRRLGVADTDIMAIVGFKTLSIMLRYAGMEDTNLVSAIGNRVAAASAAAAAARAAKVVSLKNGRPLVAPDGELHKAASVGVEKAVVNQGFAGWAGSESNTRHKDFQSSDR